MKYNRIEQGREDGQKGMRFRERLCRNNFIRRWVLFKYLVQSVMEYGVEIWGWEERGNLDSCSRTIAL